MILGIGNDIIEVERVEKAKNLMKKMLDQQY